MFLNEQIDLFNISKYMPIGNGIVGIKYDIGGKCIVRGTYSTHKGGKEIKSNFYNQVSILIKVGPGNEINCKLFGNGTIQMTGCKSKENAQQAMSILYKTLLVMAAEKKEVMLFKDMNDILLDTDNFVYSMTTKRVIGLKKNDDSYTIKNKAYKIDEKTGLFIDTKKTKNKFTILDYDGNEIGYKSVQISKGIKRLYKKNTRTTTIGDMIYFCNENTDTAIVLGQNVYTLDEKHLTDIQNYNEKMPDVLLVQYTCTPFLDGSTGRDMEHVPEFNVEIHCANAAFDLKHPIDRQVLYEELYKRDYLCKFNPQIYAGVKLVFKMPLQNSSGVFDGLCKCNNKCTCSKVTFLIFHSGKVIATGLKNESDTSHLISTFVEIIKRTMNVSSQ
jgi:TATA-box binding protein (TBP) (component of TFIID and TFIIIB)